MDTFEYTIVEKMVLCKEDKQEFIKIVQEHLNDNWKPSSDLIIHHDASGILKTYSQALIRITHVKKSEE